MTAAQVDTAAAKRSKGLDWPVFFMPPIGFIGCVNPYAVLGIPEDTPQDGIAALFPHADARLDPRGVERGAEAILADPVRRLAWHLLRCPDKPPGALAFARARLSGKARRQCAAYLLDQAVRRELRGERERLARRAGKGSRSNEALDELWAQVHRAFDALAPRKDVATELCALAARLGMNEPEALVEKVLGGLKELLPTLHALLFAMTKESDRQAFHWLRFNPPAFDAPFMTKESDRQAFHWSKVPDGMAQTPIALACVRRSKIRRLAGLKAEIEGIRQAAEQGSFMAALEGYVRLGQHIGRSDMRQRVLVAFEIGTVVMRMRSLLLSWDRHQTLASLELLRAIVDSFPGDPRVYAVMGTLHARLAAHATSFGELHGATEHMLRAAIYDPDSDFAVHLDDDGILRLKVAGVRWTMAGPNALTLLAVLNYESSAPVADGSDPHIERLRIGRMHERERRELAEWVHLALRLGLDLSGDQALATAWTLVSELSAGRDLGETFAVTRRRIQRAHPELSGIPWKHIEAAAAGDATISAGSLASKLPEPPPPFTKEKDPEVELVRLAAKRLSEYAAERRNQWRAAASTFFYPWLFSWRQPVHKLAAAAGALLIVVGLGHLSAEAWKGHRRDTAYEALCAAAAGKNLPAVGLAARRFLALTPPEVFDYRTLDVLESHSGALLRELTQAALEQRQADVTRLLSEAKELENRASREEDAWREIEAAQ